MENPTYSKHPMFSNPSPRPGYEYLAAYQLGLINQQLTEKFTNRWIESTRRKQQMDKPARSNGQNIAEGYTQTSLNGYIYLAAIARAQTSLNTPTLSNIPEEAANMLLTFCQMEGYLLKKLIESLLEKHKHEGGLTERLYRERKKYRGY